MYFKLKFFSIVQIPTLFFISFGCLNQARSIAPSLLESPAGTANASSGTGVAAPGDASVGDINPALLPVIKKQYTIFTNGSYSKDFDALEFGLLDSLMSSEVAALVRVRETIPSDLIKRDRRASLALGYEPKNSAFSVGMIANYDWLELLALRKYESSNWNLGLGGLYKLHLASGHYLFFGTSLLRLFDSKEKPFIDTGMSLEAFDGFYTFHGDLVASTVSGVQKGVIGIILHTKNYLDLRGSVGFNPENRRVFWGSGIYFGGPRINLYYSIARVDDDDTTPRQVAGLSISFY